MSYGVTNTGFIAPTQEQLVTDINTDMLADVDAGLDLSADQPMGQVNNIFAEKLAEVWEDVGVIYSATNRAGAEGALLVNIGQLTGTNPQAATYSQLLGTLNLNPGTTVPSGSIIAVNGQPTNTWILQANVTNSGGAPANFTGLFFSSVTGPFVANANTAQTIVTPVAGWNSVTNTANAVEGLAADTDDVLRARQQAELTAIGNGNTDAIAADVLKAITPVFDSSDGGAPQVFCFENTTLVLDANNVPGKSIHVVVWDGPSQPGAILIAQAIWNSKPSGISTYGATSGTAIDSQGNSHTVFWDYATIVNIYVDLTTTPTLDAGGKATVQAALASYGAAHYGLGDDVIALGVHAAALIQGLTTDVPVFTIGTSPGPVGVSNIAISGLQIALIQAANVTVT